MPIRVAKSWSNVGASTGDEILGRPDELVGGAVEHSQAVEFVAGRLVELPSQPHIQSQSFRHLDVILNIEAELAPLHPDFCVADIPVSAHGYAKQRRSQTRSRPGWVLRITRGDVRETK